MSKEVVDSVEECQILGKWPRVKSKYLRVLSLM